MKLFMQLINTDITTLKSEFGAIQVDIKDMFSQQQWEEVISLLTAYYDADGLFDTTILLGYIARIDSSRVPYDFRGEERKQRLLTFLEENANPQNYLDIAVALLPLYPYEIVSQAEAQYDRLLAYLANTTMGFANNPENTLDLAASLITLFPNRSIGIEPSDLLRGAIEKTLERLLDKPTVHDQFLDMMADIKKVWPEYFAELTEMQRVIPVVVTSELADLSGSNIVHHYARMLALTQDLMGTQVSINVNDEILYLVSSIDTSVPDQLIINC